MRHVSLVLLVLLITAPANGQAISPRKLRDAFRGGVASEKSYDSKMAAIEAAGAADNPRIADALIDAYVTLEREAEELAARRRKFLLRGGGSKLLGPLRYRLQPVRDLQDQILRVFGEMRAPDTLRKIVRSLLRMKKPLPWTLRIAIAERTRDLPEDGLAWLDSTPRKARDEEGVLVALRAIAPLGPRAERATQWAAMQLKHDSQAVQIEASRTLAGLASGAAIEPLIESVESTRGRVTEAVLDALVVLTGQHPGNTGAAWRSWLADKGGPFVRGERPLGQGDASKRSKQRDQATTTGTYFGIGQTGGSILYVFDVSLSMKQKMGVSRSGEPTTRWDRCRTELIKALDGLAPDQNFNLIGFANSLPMFEETMQRATPKNIGRAKQWLAGLKLQFQTNIYDALEVAFMFAGRGTEDRYYSCEVDTIFFLSDGAPTIPKRMKPGQVTQDDARKVLSAVRRWNALGRVEVHTVGLALRGGKKQGRMPAKKFMRELAGQNRGRFVEPGR